MGRTDRPTVYRRPGRQGLYATFWAADGSRVRHARLAVDDDARGEIIRDLLAVVQRARPGSPLECPPAIPAEYRPEVCRLYWRLPAAPADTAPPVIEAPDGPPPISQAEMGRIPEDLRPRVARLALDLAARQAELGAARSVLAATSRDLSALRTATLARAAEASTKCPPIAEALRLYGAELTGLSAGHRTAALAVPRRFAATLPSDVLNTAQVTVGQVAGWLHAEAARASKPNAHRRRLRRLLGRFLRWAARRWGYESQMVAVPGPSEGQVRRERGAIQVHTLAEIQAAIKALPSAYWKALVGCMGYAGLRLNEVRWLRPEDYVKLAGRRRGLRVAAVDFGDGDAHLLKTARSARVVPVSGPLKVLLDAHLRAGGPGQRCLFPRPRQRGTGERWGAEELTRQLNGAKAVKAKKESKWRGSRQAIPRLLPPGMTALSLRRSIATIWRQRLSADDVALLLGNTTVVTIEHYAARRADEIETNP